MTDPTPAPTSGRPPALTASVVFGGVGAVLLAAGFLTSNTPLLVLSGAAGSLSLMCALIWRSQLIEAWRANRKDGRPG